MFTQNIHEYDSDRKFIQLELFDDDDNEYISLPKSWENIMHHIDKEIIWIKKNQESKQWLTENLHHLKEKNQLPSKIMDPREEG